MSAHRLGASVVVMDRFDAERCLQLIEQYRITHVQFVPTMFVRLLKLPEAVRSRYDTSSLKAVVHAAAPCPAEVKRQMIEWWGPIISEYYSATEGMGATFITSEEALKKPGSVGKAMAALSLLILVERQQVDVEAPVARYWPEFAARGKSEVTVRMLLCHRAGLPAIRRTRAA